MTATLSLEHVTCRRGERVLFTDLSLSLTSSTVLAVAGPNGVGKTSLLRLIAGLLPQQAGRIVIDLDGRKLAEAEERRQAVAWLGMADGLKGRLTIRENLAFAVSLFAADAGAVEAALARLGLAALAERPSALLSAGQKKRAALAQMLVMGRPVWLLDEPMAALDAEGRGLVETLLAEHGQAGGIAVIAGQEAVKSAGHHLYLAGTP